MGLSNFPSASEGVLPMLVMNTVMSVALLKSMMRYVLQIVGVSGNSSNSDEEAADGYPENSRERIISIIQYKSLCDIRSNNTVSRGNSTNIEGGGSSGRGCPIGWVTMECCVCLCGFEAEEEVSELSCKHFFHKGCLEKWFDNKHSTCPLCRSIK
ncbi:RING/U-box superfamily protein [Quillaja saponaria]|uniref:RING/U-box superfamily protein n=1 Tax=Quillaja saponaria TaxID=32244 RepID=A0AAD7PJ89_QUISA|nr:RING/U-box superfamily protein [Quillaja saponaria]